MRIIILIVFLISFLVNCQGSKKLEDLAYVKTYSVEFPFVFLMKNFFQGYAPANGILTLGLFIRDSDGILLQDYNIVDQISIKSPGGSVYQINPKVFNSGLTTPIGHGYAKHGKDYYLSNNLTIPWSYMWYYYDITLTQGEEGYYEFEIKVNGKMSSSKAYFQSFLKNGLPADPMENIAPEYASNAYDKVTRILTWKKVPNAEGYRIYLYEGSSTYDASKMIYNSNGQKITNIWNTHPTDPNLVQFAIPAGVLLETGKTYAIRLDAYIYSKTIFFQDTNYSNTYRHYITVN